MAIVGATYTLEESAMGNIREEILKKKLSGLFYYRGRTITLPLAHISHGVT